MPLPPTYLMGKNHQQAHHCPLQISFIEHLPPELRIRVWASAAEPRVILLDTLLQVPNAYPLPPITQTNFEARRELRPGYQRIKSGSYVDLSYDILVCDCSLTLPYRERNPVIEELALKAENIVYWDCFPDEGAAATPERYLKWLSNKYQAESPGKLSFNRMLFPNVKELWVIKVGHVDPTWEVRYAANASYEEKLQTTARKFRYWVKEGIVEMATMGITDANLPAILRNGRCSQKECEIWNKGLNKIVSRVTFMDGDYREPTDGDDWTLVLPPLSLAIGESKLDEGEQQQDTLAGENEEERTMLDDDKEDESIEHNGDEVSSKSPKQTRVSKAMSNTLRWGLVERNLTYSLMWDGPPEDRERTVGRKRVYY